MSSCRLRNANKNGINVSDSLFIWGRCVIGVESARLACSTRRRRFVEWVTAAFVRVLLHLRYISTYKTEAQDSMGAKSAVSCFRAPIPRYASVTYTGRSLCTSATLCCFVGWLHITLVTACVRYRVTFCAKHAQSREQPLQKTIKNQIRN